MRNLKPQKGHQGITSGAKIYRNQNSLWSSDINWRKQWI